MKLLSSIKKKGLTSIVRVDYNVPMKNNRITDDRRIKATLPTIKYLLKLDHKIIIISHLGRPKARYDKNLSLKPISTRLKKLLDKKITFIKDPLSQNTKDMIEKSKDKIFLLENIRFYRQEKSNSPQFSKDLAKLADIYINDAFGACHRAHASTEGITHYLPSYAGLLLEKETKELKKALKPKKPLILILGGVKVSDKIGVINNFLNKARYILIGGAMCFTFLKSKGYETGKSIIEKDKLTMAKLLLRKSKKKIILPLDIITAKDPDNRSKASIHTIEDLPKKEIGLDIGPATIKLFRSLLKDANTIVWNGSMGLSEIDKFSKGTKEIAKALASSKATTIIGGGDTSAAIDKLNLAKKMTHVSTGGGAALEFLKGKDLPGIRNL